MMQAKVKIVLKDKGFGFAHLCGEDVFFHTHDFVDDSFESLEPGDVVEFEQVEGPKGPRAKRVHKVEITQATPAN